MPAKKTSTIAPSAPETLPLSEAPQGPSIDAMACVRGEAASAEAAPPAADAVEAAVGARSIQQIVSKAAIRRLAHDVGARLGKDAHATALQGLEAYVARVLQLAASAMAFSRRRSISLHHVLFAAGVCGGVPAGLRAMTPEDLKRLNKCNPQAPPGLRKDVLSRAEISEASFAKVTKSIAKQSDVNLRITGQARRMLQLLAEYQVMRGFDRRGTLAKPEEETPMVQDMCNLFECDAAAATLVTALVLDVCTRVPQLLALGATKTVDDRLIRTALASAQTWASTWMPPPDFVSAKAVKVVERILRGRAADKRVTSGASLFLAACCMRLVLESRGLAVSVASSASSAAAPLAAKSKAAPRESAAVPEAREAASADASKPTKPTKTIEKSKVKIGASARALGTSRGKESPKAWQLADPTPEVRCGKAMVKLA